MGCLWVSSARPAAAMPFKLEYEAPAGCPTREAFVEAVRERVPEAQASDEPGRYTFRVKIEAEGERARGQLELGDGVPPRQVALAPCADVANSMVLMIAMLLSGDRLRFPDRYLPPGEEEPPPSEGAEAAPAPASEAPAAAAPVVETTAPARVATAPVRERTRAPSRERDTFRGGAWGAAGLADGVAPFPAIALSGGAELELPWIGGLKPSARAGVTYASGDTSVDGFGGAEFRLLAFAARLCPHSFSLSSRWTLAACASFELGELTARGVRTANRLVQRMPWTAAGVAPRLELALSRVFSLEGELGLRGIVRHDRFVFEPGATEVYDVPRFATHLALGASARFP